MTLKEGRNDKVNVGEILSCKERILALQLKYMHVNYIAIVIATLVQFMIGALWYTVIFGKLWGKMHGFDKLSKEEQEKMQKEVMPFYGVQILMTFISTFVLALFINYTGWNPFALAAFMWLGFVLPTEVSSVIFSGTEKKWMLKKIAVQAGSILVCLEVAATILNLFG